MAARQRSKEMKLGLPFAVEVLSEIMGNSDVQKVVNEISALPADKRTEFIEKELGRDGLVRKGIRPRGAAVKFRPADKTKGKKGVVMNQLMRLDVYIPDVGVLSVRRKY